MAEWIGPRHRERGTYDGPEPVFISGPLTVAPPLPEEPPEAPGAVTSPQMPGEVPDRSTIPGQYAVSVAPNPDARRPLTEYQTAQRIMGVFRAEPGQEREPARFEQATASFEELRKADPAQWPPGRPRPGYALDTSEPVESLAEQAEGSNIEP
jgi:hypothetical protein